MRLFVTRATPSTSCTGPSEVPSSRKSTDPVGLAPDPVTVAVKVTASPQVDGAFEETSVVVVGRAVIRCENATEVVPSCVASPAQTAVIARQPTASAEVVVRAVAWSARERSGTATGTALMWVDGMGIWRLEKYPQHAVPPSVDTAQV